MKIILTSTLSLKTQDRRGNMLILSRKNEESIIINGNIEIKILDAANGIVKIGIVAPKNVEVHRKEVFEKIREENRASTTTGKALDELMKKSD